MTLKLKASAACTPGLTSSMGEQWHAGLLIFHKSILFANLVSAKNRNDQEQIHSSWCTVLHIYYRTLGSMLLKTQKELTLCLKVCPCMQHGWMEFVVVNNIHVHLAELAITDLTEGFWLRKGCGKVFWMMKGIAGSLEQKPARLWKSLQKMRLLSPLDTNGKTEKKQSQASLETKSGRLLWGVAVSLLFSAGLFITDVKSMTFLTRIKQFSLKSVSQIRSLGKK